MEEQAINIEDRSKDYKLIDSQIWNTEVGLRAISVMYDEHSDDKNSKDNIYLLKDNIQYRLFSSSYQYLLFLRELSTSEEYLHNICVKDPNQIDGYLYSNPHFDKVEQNLSSIFDGIIFNLSSVFDYLSHMACYICRTDKSRTLYWTKLAKLCRNNNSDFKGEKIKKMIDIIDRRFVGRLYDYRSRLLHKNRDHHQFTTNVQFRNDKIFDFDIKVLASSLSLKQFKIIKEEINSDKITLTFLSSWLIKNSLSEIENILESIVEEIRINSSFSKNLRKPKNPEGILMVNIDPKTNFIVPASDKIWEEYKKGRKSFG